jgi:tetratricopeptide (TPR) repeat protein
VKNVIVELNELISRITADHKIQKKVEEPLSINIFTTNTSGGKSTTGLNGQFVFSQVLIECLLRLKSTQTDKTELVNVCKTEYEGNHSELNNLCEFEEEYSSNKVLWWYTRESFFYRTLNAALRTQDIHMIFLFHEFIADILHQLQYDQVKSPLRVYRSQMMSTDELDDLKRHIGQFISVHSFFSTSINRTTALFFLGDTTSLIDLELERVLFEIDADPQMVTTKPFADISKYSHFIDESEVLFMIGSIFRLKSINCNDDHVWIIEMSLCSDDEYDLKQVLLHMKQQIGDGETNLRTLAKVLWKMGKFDLAEKYFKRLLDELPSSDYLLCNLYEDLGELASQTGDYDMSVQWHQKSLEVKNQNESIVKTNSNTTHISIGEFIERNSIIFKQGFYRRMD